MYSLLDHWFCNQSIAVWWLLFCYLTITCKLYYSLKSNFDKITAVCISWWSLKVSERISDDESQSNFTLKFFNSRESWGKRQRWLRQGIRQCWCSPREPQTFGCKRGSRGRQRQPRRRGIGGQGCRGRSKNLWGHPKWGQCYCCSWDSRGRRPGWLLRARLFGRLRRPWQSKPKEMP